jgi:hypothetical protein
VSGGSATVPRRDLTNSNRISPPGFRSGNPPPRVQSPSNQGFQREPSRTQFKLLIGLAIGCLLPAGPVLAEERPVIKPPLQRQLESLVLSEVRLSDIDFMDALAYLQKKAQASPQRATRVPFVAHLPGGISTAHLLFFFACLALNSEMITTERAKKHERSTT